ncbi:hypothetical protein JCM8097_001817 [Rhodosporidiobolus ruineniae]
MPIDPPEPSPAPTIDSVQFPGFYPPTPSVADSLKQLADEQQREDLETAGKTVVDQLVAVASDPLGTLGQLLPLPDLPGVGLPKPLPPADNAPALKGDSTSNTPTPTASRPGTAVPREGEETTSDVPPPAAPEFGQTAVEKEQAALASSPVQKLVSGDEEDGARLTGEGAIGAALLQGAAGAKVEENEVRAPGVEADEKERNGLVEETETATIPPPDFGTPAIEKELSALHSSPAQQLLRYNTASSSVTQAEESLLAGAAGAKVADKEVEEPAKAPLEKLEERSAAVGAPLGLPKKEEEGEQPHAVDLKREISSPPSPQKEHDLHLASLPSRPDLGKPADSTSSFAAEVLAAAERVHTPTETGAGAAMGFGAGEREVRASDRDEGSEATGPNAIPLPVPTPKTRSNEPESPSPADESVVHNPAPLVPAALAGTAAGASLLGPESQNSGPDDFEPYQAPVVEQNKEAKVAAATPLPETPLAEVPSKSFAPAITGLHGVYPNSPPTSPLDRSESASTIPATVNAQNLKQEEEEDPHSNRNKVLAAGAGGAALGGLAAAEMGRDGSAATTGTTGTGEEIPIETALPAGPELASSSAPVAGAAVVPVPVEGASDSPHPVTNNALAHRDLHEPVQADASVPHATHPEHFEEEERREKGKGREVIEGAAVGAGAGVLADEAYRGTTTFPPSSSVAEPPALTTLPTSSTIDTVGSSADPNSQTANPLEAQRAYPTVPHMLRPGALNETDEPVLVPSSPKASTATALDPKLLAASSIATSPEQAGFASVPEGGKMTGAMQDFAHLSEPSKAAEQKALAESSAATATAPVEDVERREYEEGTGRDGLSPATAGLVGAGVGAGAVGAAVVAHDHAAPAAAATAVPAATTSTIPPPIGAQPASTGAPVGASSLPAGAAPAQPAQVVQYAQPAAVQQPQQQYATPVSRFVEQPGLSPSRPAAGTMGYETPSSTRAVKGTPAGTPLAESPTASELGAGTRTPSPGATPPPGSANVSRRVSLVEAGIIEKSKHMKIQTHRTPDGHKRLHRKSLSGSVHAPIFAQPAAQPQYVQQAPSGPTGAEGEVAARPHLPAIQSEREIERRDRMLDDIVGVRDPTTSVPSAAPVQPRLSTSTNSSTSSRGASTHSTAPLVSHATPGAPNTAQPAAVVAPTSPVVHHSAHAGPTVATHAPGSHGVSRKLSKASRRSASGSEHDGAVKKEGFFSRLTGGHKRTASNGSAGGTGAASPRASGEVARV